MAGSSPPDSAISISSLLASCSLRRSRNDGARPPASIQYKDRLYDSASQALDDYIVDYEAASTGKITVRSSPTRRARPSVRHRPSLTRSRYVAHDPDLLSLTTDDLLGFPPDGSLPFTRASERKRRKNQYGFSPHVTLTSPLTTSSHTGRNLSALDLHDHRLRSQELQRRKEKSHLEHLLARAERENHSGRHNNVDSILYKSYPRWLTSHKSELGVSGITSIPDVQYPVWLRDHRLLDDPDSRIPRTGHGDGPITKIPHRPSSSSSSACSQRLRCDQRGYEMVNSGNSADSRKRTARSDLDIMEHLHTPVKNHPVQHSGGAAHLSPQPNRSPQTEDVLEAERSWENVPYSYKSPVHVLCEDEKPKGLQALKSNLVEDFLKDCAQHQNTAVTFSGGNHHGPVEALKHILFNLQAFQQNVNPDAGSGHLKEFQKISTAAESEIQRVDQEIFPVNKSLQKALQHLSRLKELVGDCHLKRNEEHKPELQT